MNWRSSSARLALLELLVRGTLKRRRAQESAWDTLDTKGLPGAWPNDLDLGEAPVFVRELAAHGLWLEQEPLAIDPRTTTALEGML